MSRPLSAFAGASLLLATSTLLAQDATPSPNAALNYWQAFALMPQLDEQEAHHFGGKPGAVHPPNYLAAPLNETAVGLIRRSETALQMLQLGAEQKLCMWGVQLDRGPHALLPHTAKARHLAGLACLRARYRFENDAADKAVEDLAAALTLARHIGEDRTLIGLFVQWVIEKQVITLAAAQVPHASRSALESFASKLDSLPSGGSLESVLQVEKKYLLEWYIERLSQRKATATIEEVFGPDAQTIAVAKSASDSLDELTNMLKALRPFYAQLAEVTAIAPPQRMKRFESIQQDAEKASPLAKLFIPGYRYPIANAPLAGTRITMLRAAIDIALSGPQRVEAYHDPFGGQLKYRSLGDEPAFELSSAGVNENEKFAITFGKPKQ